MPDEPTPSEPATRPPEPLRDRYGCPRLEPDRGLDTCQFCGSRMQTIDVQKTYGPLAFDTSPLYIEWGWTLHCTNPSCHTRIYLNWTEHAQRVHALEPVPPDEAEAPHA